MRLVRGCRALVLAEQLEAAAEVVVPDPLHDQVAALARGACAQWGAAKEPVAKARPRAPAAEGRVALPSGSRGGLARVGAARAFR